MKIIASIVAAALWLPIFIHFYRAWRKRKNPISLSICGIVVFVAYSLLMRPYETKADPEVVLWTAYAAGSATALFFYAAAWEAAHRFRGNRHEDPDLDKSDDFWW